jgi:hypothetical protein
MTVYRNARDSVRIVVHERLPRPGALRGEWDVAVWTSSSVVHSYSEDGDAFATKREARAWAEAQYGKLTPLSAMTHPEVTSHWRKR